VKVLIVEDDQEKALHVSEFVKNEYGAVVQIAKSFGSGLKALIGSGNSIDLVLLDMSMPNFDVSLDEPQGGAPESFAGKELLAQMKLRGIHVPTVILTMFDSFGDQRSKVSLDQLVKDLEREFAPTYRGYVFYSETQAGWRSSLKRQIDRIFGGRQ
jgi:CheY-like chemotaxis protein